MVNVSFLTGGPKDPPFFCHCEASHRWRSNLVIYTGIASDALAMTEIILTSDFQGRR